MTFGHIFVVHALYGGFFGWLGILGAVAPDLPGIVGHYRRLAGTSDRWPFDGTWWSFMSEEAKEWYGRLHTLQAAGAVCALEILVRMMASAVWIAVGGSFAIDITMWIPAAGIGWTSHVVSDWLTHSGDVARIVGSESGVAWGVNWWETKWYWTEWLGMGIAIVAGAIAGWPNVLIGLLWLVLS